jgi:2-iminobutanoate/2-iminopropanoate deaminase
MPKDRQPVNAPGAPAAVGPYSHAVATGDLLFCSGQIALDPETNEVVGETAGQQARRALQNLQAVCEAAGTTLDRAIRCTVYLTTMGAFNEVNEVYEQFFTDEPPARVAFAVAGLPKGGLVEIDAVVALS